MRIAVLAWLGVVLVGCGSSADCVAGRSEPCACADGRSGAQTCLPDGTFAACVCADVDSGVDVDAGGPIDSGSPDDAGVAMDSGTVVEDDGGPLPADGGPPPVDAGPIHGHAVVLGVWGGIPEDGSDQMIANAVWLSERGSTTLRVLDYIAHAPGLEDPASRAHVHSLIDTEAASRGRTTSYSTLTTDTGLAAALADTDVFYLYDQGSLDETAARTTATFWHDDLLDFLDAGGVVVVTALAPSCSGSCRAQFRLVEGAGLFTFGGTPASVGSAGGVPIEISAPSDPIAAGIASPFPTGTGNWACFPSSTGGTVVARVQSTLCPVARHLVR